MTSIKRLSLCASWAVLTTIFLTHPLQRCANLAETTGRWRLTNISRSSGFSDVRIAIPQSFVSDGPCSAVIVHSIPRVLRFTRRKITSTTIDLAPSIGFAVGGPISSYVMCSMVSPSMNRDWSGSNLG